MVVGEGGLVPPGGTETHPLNLFVGNAGTAARFLAPFLCLGSGVYRLHGVPRMHLRPQAALFSALRELGYRIECEFGNDKLPARIFTGTAGLPPDSMTQFIRRKQAPAMPKKCRVSIEESSQFASALLLSAGVGNWQVEIVGENADESPYVAMTAKLVAAFPKGGGTFQIEPDASSGSYFWAIDWILWVTGLNSEMEQITVKNWPKTNWQIDADYPKHRNLLEVKGNISRKTDLGDSIMTAIVKAPFNRSPQTSQFVFPDPNKIGVTGPAAPIIFTDLGRLRVQETERVFALRNELKKCGVDVREDGDTLTVFPGIRSPKEPIETYNDHRMAMCFAIVGLKIPGIKIINPACVKKTFPNFFQKLAGLDTKILDARTGHVLSHIELFAE
jgi:3-phosphoshikimate 1-carboxyvinyltransferase